MLGEEVQDLYEAEQRQRGLAESFQKEKNTVLRSHGRPPW